MNNELSRELSYAKEKVQYDTQCKRVLSQKQILAWILKRTVKEFTDLPVRRIIPYIEGTPKYLLCRYTSGKRKTLRQRMKISGSVLKRFPVCLMKTKFQRKEPFILISVSGYWFLKEIMYK